jgi:hypothetical protein
MTRRLLDFIRERELSHPSGVEMMSIVKSLGTTIEQVEGRLSYSDEFAIAKAWFFDEWLANAVAAGVLTSEEARAWLADQEAHASDGRFSIGFPLFLIKASKQ